MPEGFPDEIGSLAKIAKDAELSSNGEGIFTDPLFSN